MNNDDIHSIRALPCGCGQRCLNGFPDKNRCPCFIARITKKVVAFYYCKICKAKTWHIGIECVKCKQRADNGR